MLTQARLKELLHYDPETGIFTWLDSVKHCRAGMKAGTNLKLKNRRTSYTHIKVDDTYYLAHRLAFLYMTGKLPTEMVDHKDENGENNRWSNLRECTRIENSRNTKKPRHNTSGEKHVGWHKRDKRWFVAIKSGGKTIFYKLCKSFDEAVSLARQKRTELHGDFANHG